MADEKNTKILINCGAGKVGTSKGVMGPGDSQELPIDEANKLLKYHGIKDAADKVPAQANEIDRLKAENTELAKTNSDLRRQLASVKSDKHTEPAEEPAPEKKGKGKK